MKDKPIKIQLKELDKSSFYPITKLEVLEEQKECVANNSFSMAQAYFHKEALFRGIYVDDEPGGKMAKGLSNLNYANKNMRREVKYGKR